MQIVLRQDPLSRRKSSPTALKQGRWDPELVEAVPSPLVPIQLVGVPVTVTPGPP